MIYGRDINASETTQAGRCFARFVGVVASDKGDKTIKVVVNYQTRHPKYGKYLSAAPCCTPTTRRTKPRKATRWKSPSAAR